MPQLTEEQYQAFATLRDSAEQLAETLDGLLEFGADNTDYMVWTMGLTAGAMNRVLRNHTNRTLAFLPAEQTEDAPEPPVINTSSLIAEAESLLAQATEGPWSNGPSYGSVISTLAVPTDFELEHGYFQGYGGVMVCESVRANNSLFLARSHGLVTELVAALKDANTGGTCQLQSGQPCSV